MAHIKKLEKKQKTDYLEEVANILRQKEVSLSSSH